MIKEKKFAKKTFDTIGYLTNIPSKLKSGG